MCLVLDKHFCTKVSRFPIGTITLTLAYGIQKKIPAFGPCSSGKNEQDRALASIRRLPEDIVAIYGIPMEWAKAHHFTWHTFCLCLLLLVTTTSLSHIH